MYYIIFISFLLLVLIIINLPVFGGKPGKAQVARFTKLPNYTSGSFQNQSPTPTLPPEASYWKIIKMMIKGNTNGTPKHSLPFVIPDFSKSVPFKLVWFGHSSYLIQVNDLNVLVDPVFSERPSPFQFIGTKRFDGTKFVDPANLPFIDVVVITHDHYDHLDYHTILALKTKTKIFVTSLGVGAHLLKWGVEGHQIVELNWHDTYSFSNDLIFTALPARHFSGRLFKRNQTLWSSFILTTPNEKVYIGGDSGYDEHFKLIGAQHGPFDLAILECGQYNEMWPLIHMFPEQTVQASIDLNAKKLLPVHWGKYRLALHNWDEPISKLVEAAKAKGVEVTTPMLGETCNIHDDKTVQWWKN